MQAVHPIGQLRVRRTPDLKKQQRLSVLKHVVVPAALATTVLLGVFLPMGYTESGEYETVLTASAPVLQSNAVMSYYKASALSTTTPSTESVTVGQSDGSDVTLIGDSISVHSKSAILQKLPKAHIDAKSGTYMKRDSADFGASGFTRLRALKSSGQLRDVLIFAMGTNRDFQDDQQLADYIKELVSIAGTETKIILMTFFSPEKSSYPRWSTSIKTVASNYDNITIADWEQALNATGNPRDYILSEAGTVDVHPNDKGRELFASILYTAVNEVTSMRVAVSGGDSGTVTLLSGKVVTNGTTVDIPTSVSQTGLYSFYTDYDRKWAARTYQREIYDQWVAKGKTSKYSIAMIDDCYLVAVAQKFGTTGDIITVKLEDGSQFKAIVADAKNPKDPLATEWGHLGWSPSGSKNDIIEWERAGNDLNKGLREAGFYGKKVVSITNYGSWLKG